MVHSLYLTEQRLRPMHEAPTEPGPFSALIFCIDLLDPVSVHLDRELYIYTDGTWYGELSGKTPPKSALWWLPEADLTMSPVECLRNVHDVVRLCGGECHA